MTKKKRQLVKMEVARKVGRPALPADEKTHPRSIRMNDARWAKLQQLGREWLENAIDKAKKGKPDA